MVPGVEFAWSNGSGKTNILEGINIVSGWGPLETGNQIFVSADMEQRIF